MKFYDYLLTQYGKNEPIFFDSIKFNNYSKSWINKELDSLVKSNLLIRFDKGIYYIPTMTKIGLSKLNPIKVIEKKYLYNDSSSSGYYSGITLLNKLGLTNQVPNTLEIYSNNESSKVREVLVGNIKILLRRSRTKVKKENVDTQMFLEIMNDIDAYTLTIENKKKILEFIKERNIKKEDISKFSVYFPDKAIRNLIETGIVFEIK